MDKDFIFHSRETARSDDNAVGVQSFREYCLIYIQAFKYDVCNAVSMKTHWKYEKSLLRGHVMTLRWPIITYILYSAGLTTHRLKSRSYKTHVSDLSNDFLWSSYAAAVYRDRQ